jgi:hypothetical protein
MATSNIFFASSNQIYNFDPFANGFTFETWANFQSFTTNSASIITGDPYFSSNVLLLHADNSLVDTSINNTTLTNTSSTYSSSIFKFGSASFSFNGTSYLTSSSSANFAFGSGNFTIEFWMYPTAAFNGFTRIMANLAYNGAYTNGNWNIGGGGTILSWYCANGGGFNCATTISTNTWYHVAFVRNGTTISCYLNGVLDGSGAISTTAIDNGTSALALIGAAGTSYGYTGYLDEIRITKGIARYTTNFLVPQFSFPDSIGTQLVEYPSAAMTTNSTAISGRVYGNGTYVSSASSTQTETGNIAIWGLFDKSAPNKFWVTSIGRYAISTGVSNAYTGSTGAPFTTTFDGSSSVSCEWLQLQLPQSIVLTSYSITGFTSNGYENPATHRLVGSNNGTTWVTINYVTDTTWANIANETKTFTVGTTPNAYIYYRLLIIAISGNGGGYATMSEWRLFGPPVAQYPPAAMTTDSTAISGQPYGNGTYISSVSSVQTTNYGYYAFDKTISGNRWISATNLYSATSGVYTGSTTTIVSGIGTVYGEWLQIQMPQSIILTSYSLTNSTNGGNFILAQPISWVIAGSNDGTSWTYIDQQFYQTYSSTGLTNTFSVTLSSSSYQYFRIIANTIGASSTLTQCEIGDWVLFGINPNNLNSFTTSINNVIPSLLTLRGDLTQTNSLFSFGVTNTGKLCSYWNNYGPYGAVGTNTLNLNQWYHLAVASSSSNLRMFINGSLDTAVTIPTSLNGKSNGNYLLIGSVGSQYSTNAFLSNIRLIYGSAIYNSSAGFYVPTNSLTPYPINLGTGKCILLLKSTGNTTNTLQTTNNLVVAGNNYTSASGGTVTYYTIGAVTYAVHSFTTTGASTFVLNENKVCDILVIAGGGGGGGAGGGGGGGAGGFQYFANASLTSGSYSVTVGAGGTGSSGANATPGTNGGNSVFGSLPPSIGGGGAGTNFGGSTGSSGGSGGGTGAGNTPGNGTPGQGYNGANTMAESGLIYGAGGGGGAGGAGIPGNNSNPGSGGPGLACSITGNLIYYAGGGAGGLYQASPIAFGGVGGGGCTGGNGLANTGGGGGGSIGNGSSQAGTAANGGSGIVIIRYVLNKFSITNTISKQPCLFDNLSQAALSYAKGIFSLKRLLTSYTGPVINISRSSDSTRLDFFSDAYGNLGAYYNGTWTPIATWLGTSTGTVVLWYDQSGNGKPLGTPSSGTAPTISLGTENRLFFTGSTNSLQSVPGLLASVAGVTGAQYTYFGIWNKTDTNGAVIMEHNIATTNTNNQRSCFNVQTSAYGFTGWFNDNLAIATYSTNIRMNSVMRVNNSLSTNIYIKSNNTDYSGATSGTSGNYTNLVLNNTGFTVGRRYTDNTEYFNGYISMVAVFGNYITNYDATYLATL